MATHTISEEQRAIAAGIAGAVGMEANSGKKNTHGCCADKVCTDKTCMELPAGTTCGDCRNFRHCEAFYAHKATDTYCDFYPRRFVVARATGGGV